jgi:hypothetical protein
MQLTIVNATTNSTAVLVVRSSVVYVCEGGMVLLYAILMGLRPRQVGKASRGTSGSTTGSNRVSGECDGKAEDDVDIGRAFHSDDWRVRDLTKPNNTAGAGARNVALKTSKTKIGKGSIFAMYGAGREKEGYRRCGMQGKM